MDNNPTSEDEEDEILLNLALERRARDNTEPIDVDEAWTDEDDQESL